MYPDILKTPLEAHRDYHFFKGQVADETFDSNTKKQPHSLQRTPSRLSHSLQIPLRKSCVGLFVNITRPQILAPKSGLIQSRDNEVRRLDMRQERPKDMNLHSAPKKKMALVE